MRILIPDAGFLGEPDIERQVAGPDAAVDVQRARRADDVPDSSWASCDAMILWQGVAILAATVGRLKRCRIIVRAGVGYDDVDVTACGERGIPVCNVPDYGTSEVADHTIALMLALTRGIATFHEVLKRDPVRGWRYLAAPLVQRLRGKTFGVIGLGRIGAATALRARAFGLEAAFYDPHLPDGHELALGFGRAQTLDGLLARADVVSLHTPLTDETRGMIDKRAIARMKQGALLINTARGALVDLEALYDGLKEGPLAGAALDVMPEEPPDSTHPLVRAWQNDEPWLTGRLIITPHAAFYSPAGIEELRRKTAQTVVDYLRDGRLRNCVNAELLSARPGQGPARG